MAGKMETTNLTVRVVNSPEEVERFNTKEARHHELDKTHSGGDTLRLVFENEEIAVVERR